jgi:cation diffusion facilitator CzcD-associated flavoprotein CzcO
MFSKRVVVVGAGPAGLAVAASLREHGVEAELLERGAGVGESWRHHYERLHLHTVKELSALPGIGWGAETPRYPSREQVVEYLERYARHFGLEPHFGVEVLRASPVDGGWRLETSKGAWEASQLVVATGFNARPYEPRWPGREDFGGSIEHSSAFRTGAGHSGQRVLVVGAGNSGAEIALDLCEHGASVSLSVRDAQHVLPRDFLGLPSQKSSVRMRRLPLRMRDAIASTISRLAFGDLGRYGLRRPNRGPISRVVLEGKIPLLDVGTVARIRSGEIAVVPGVERFTQVGVVLTDGRHLDVAHVVLATGYRAGLERWIDGVEVVLDERGVPSPPRGRLLPGLWVIGFENTPTGLLRQIGEAAPDVARRIVRAAGESPP